jgi:restriction system protein
MTSFQAKDPNSSKQTIVQAATQVLQESGKAMTANEIYDAIISAGLFSFNTQAPISILRKQIRRHCQGVELANGPKSKLFRIEPDGKYALISQ